jgi:phage-related protein
MGMPLVKKLVANLWEVRISLDNKIDRVIFTVKDDKMILLHGFIKKSQKLPEKELDIAKNRLNNLSIN